VATKLVIVESPAKSKTIENYLGSEFTVMSSVGHIRDLVVKGRGGFGVDIENNFKPEYRILSDKADIVKKLKKAADEAEHIFLATDPDREGEAISWHLAEVLNQPKDKVSRIVFNEVTKNAILYAILNDRGIDQDLVYSQESRRILDRIIGFRLSSLMQQKIGSKSAGRVQSVALKLIVDREKEIEAFSPEEYWEIIAEVEKNHNILKAKFFGDLDGKIKLTNQRETTDIITKLNKNKYIVQDIIIKERNKVSRPPFITSTLQQEASGKLNYNSKRTMMIAQRLYEGIDLEQERIGLITYMRTDSTRLSDDFIHMAKEYITTKFGEKHYKGIKKNPTKHQNVQDAHEAIRPTSLKYSPDSIKKYLNYEEYKLYSLIYHRAIASLMSDAKVEDTKVEIHNGQYLFYLDGEKILFEGYLSIYEEFDIDDNEQNKSLPEFKIGEQLKLSQLIPTQKFTTPPSRYSEARLIRKMEELGIGRPSTYAMTMDTLRIRSYVTMDKKTFIPTEQGRITSEQLDAFFHDIINVKYTANMEKVLDDISEGKRVWHNELRKFYDKFAPLIEHARDNMVRIYPKATDEYCPTCGLQLLIRRGPFGEFTACSGYPKCKYIKKTPKKDDIKIGVICPICNEGEIVERVANRGRSKGKIFYACNRYPKCKATFSGIPNGEICLVCDGVMISTENESICSNEKCKTRKNTKSKLQQ
jgi:DNA topoisomerase-1